MPGLVLDVLCTKRFDMRELAAAFRVLFDAPESEVFVSHADDVDEALRDVQRDGPFGVYCTYDTVGGDFVMSVMVSVSEELSARTEMDDLMFAGWLTEQTGSDVLGGFDRGSEPWLWTVVRSDGTSAVVHLREQFDGDDSADTDDRCPCGLPSVTVVFRGSGQSDSRALP